MKTLYVKTGCPYCGKVLSYLESNSVPMQIKNVADEGVRDELIQLGGKAQVPFLIDEDTGTHVYESDAIISYLSSI
jgi:glutaredoxin